MRMRKKKNLNKRMERCSGLLIKDEAGTAGKWKKIFKNDNPLHVEIGCGKGKFISKLAKNNPDINYVAMEKVEECLVMAMEKALEGKLKNLYFLSEDAKDFLKFFKENEIDRIYLNFSDPWRKSKHYKRRLTYRAFLDLYRKALKEHGEIRQKTDNRLLFEFSIDEFEVSDFLIKRIECDLHNSDIHDNIMTEYEENFCAKGLPIYYLEATVG